MFMHAIVVPFLAGFVSVLVFHQGVWAIFAAAGKTPMPAWSMQPSGPLNIPSVVSSSFWGGVWGIVMQALVLPAAQPTLGYWVTCVVLGSLLTTLVALLIVFPMKGRAFAAGGNPVIWVFALLVNAAWGFGLGLLLPILGRLLWNV